MAQDLSGDGLHMASRPWVRIGLAIRRRTQASSGWRPKEKLDMAGRARSAAARQWVSGPCMPGSRCAKAASAAWASISR